MWRVEETPLVSHGKSLLTNSIRARVDHRASRREEGIFCQSDTAASRRMRDANG
jgi:hypothetical protein